MKYIKTSILIIPIFIAAASCGEDYPVNKVPSVVQNTVRAKFPGALDIDWEKTTGNFEAEFDLNNVEFTVYVDSTGKLISYKNDIKVAEFPAAILATINAEYIGYRIHEAEKVEEDNRLYYQAELKNKQKKNLHLVFSADGKPATQINYLK